MKNLYAVGENVIVEVLKTETAEEEVIDSGIIIPETAIKRPQGYGKVLSTGSQVNIPVVVGDTIIFHKNGGMDIIVGKTIYKVLKQQEVYARLDKVPKEEVS